MKKMRVFMAGMALAVLLAYSCRLPDSIEIGTNNLELSIPVRATVDIAELIRENLPEGLYDVRVFDMPNFASDISHGSPPQAFLIAIELDMLPSFNPADYLDQIGGIDDMGDAAIDPIEADIVVPQIAWEAIEVSEYFLMEGLFYTMENSLNTYSMPTFPPITSPVPIPLIPGTSIPIGEELLGGIQNVSFFAFRDGDPERANFESVIVSRGGDGFSNTIELELENAHPLPPGLRIIMTDIRIEGADSGDPIGIPHSQNIVLDEFSQRGMAAIDISNAHIMLEDPPKFTFGEIIVEYTGSSFSSFTPNITVRLRVNRIALRGARGLRIGTLRHQLPETLRENIRMDSPEGFLNAEIGRGTFAITVETPPYVPGVEQTYGEGLEVGVELAVSQAPKFLGGESFGGLVGPWKLGTDAPLVFEDRPLEERTINGSSIEIDPDNSVLIVQSGPNGISFELFDEHYDNKTLPVTIRMEMHISMLDAIRWELDEELIPVPEIELDFRDMGGRDVTEFIERITFSKIGVKLDITALDQSLDGNIALSITSPPLGFADDADPLVLRKGENNIESSASEASLVTLNLMENPIVPINVGFVPVIDGVPVVGGRYLKLGPLYIADDQEETRLSLSAEVSLDFVWTEADVNLTHLLGDEYNLSGGIPEEPINIGEMLGDFMVGDFTFSKGSLDIGLFLDGPVDIVTKIAPTLTLTAYTGGGSEIPLFDGEVQIDGGFPTLPDDTGVWERPGLPSGGLQGLDADGFIDIFASKPEALSFFYEVVLGEGGVITVEPEMFYGAEAGDIRGLVLIKVAL